MCKYKEREKQRAVRTSTQDLCVGFPVYLPLLSFSRSPRRGNTTLSAWVKKATSACVGVVCDTRKRELKNNQRDISDLRIDTWFLLTGEHLPEICLN